MSPTKVMFSSNCKRPNLKSTKRRGVQKWNKFGLAKCYLEQSSFLTHWQKVWQHRVRPYRFWGKYEHILEKYPRWVVPAAAAGTKAGWLAKYNFRVNSQKSDCPTTLARCLQIHWWGFKAKSKCGNWSKTLQGWKINLFKFSRAFMGGHYLQGKSEFWNARKGRVSQVPLYSPFCFCLPPAIPHIGAIHPWAR